MIRKFIDRLLGKAPATDDGLPAGVSLGQRVEYGVDQHKIDLRLIIEPAVNVCKKLKDAGYEAYIVGGAVRDLLVNLEPKDFDVATNATPEQVKALFRRAFIVGRRFRLVHVIYGRGREHEKIEVSTFRAYLDNADAASAVKGNEKTSRTELDGKSHAVDASGRVLRDNVWGPQNEDAARRDITVNAMYYDPSTQIVVDYHGGMNDSKAKLLRMIGDPETRYREDPVRIIRVLRFAAKMGYRIEARTEAPIRKMKALLANVPSSRMFEELLKLLQTGHSLQSIAMLKKYGLDRGVFPILDSYFEGIATNPAREDFVNRALADTDRRVNEGKSVAPSFLMACVFWHEVSARWDALRAQGESLMPALQAAVDATFDARIGDISGRGKLAADMREIWQMQPRFDKRTGSSPAAMLAQPRFRAAFDFMRLRADAGEIDMALVEWWEDYSMGDEDKRRDLLEVARKQAQSRPREPRPAPRDPRPLKTSASPAPVPEAERAPAPAPRVSAAKQQMLQLAATARAALADGATDADRAALRSLLDNAELPFGTVGPDAPPLTATQELLREFADLTLVAIADGATAADLASARSLLDKVEKKANTTRRRRGGGGRRKAGAGPAFKDDEDDEGDGAE
ncbi:polynucleotide adenylyltransferase PcnB [Scleromatobacter humisilvae]|uniref:Poly(A) polymerase I n=1 Tax=Scleromatobacter humisilvae TaxID=2897159 RepID=A0A9X1YRA3_9BURK|nr:polynucleotide adenylyltransferase PcnB [Scleromatobacter humisilvae]MCK9687021.1 polynucleotide adenylyltransferase PcnB [Scleromatobacter humisilvae]